MEAFASIWHNSRPRGPLSGRYANFCNQVLADDLSLDPTISDSLPAVLKQSCDEMLASAGRPLGYLLFDRTSDLAVDKTLKDYAKELVSRRDSEAGKAAATAIYYAAIASALIFHGNKITRHSYGRLQNAYEDLERKDWIPSDLKDLFKKANAACQEKKS